MLLNAELLLQYIRCQRKAYLDTNGDLSQREPAGDLLLKLQQEKFAHQKTVLAQYNYQRPDYPKGDWEAGAKATLELMQQGVESIFKGVILTQYEDITLLSRPSLLIKQSGKSQFGDWQYIPANIHLGKRPKLEYQIVAAYDAEMLAIAQAADPAKAWLFLRRKDVYTVDLAKWIPQMHVTVADCIQTLKSSQVPEVFISRQKCNLCGWFKQCYAEAKSQQHLSLLPGISPNRYSELQAINVVSLEPLAKTNPDTLDSLPGFEGGMAQQVVLQAQSVVQDSPILLPFGNAYEVRQTLTPTSQTTLKELFKGKYYPPNIDKFVAPIELYFDIEAQPDLNLDYLLGVLVVDRWANTESYYAFLAESQAEEGRIWQEFQSLVNQYPQAPIFHFCPYEVDTVKRLAQLYNTPKEQLKPLLERFIDVYEEMTQMVVLPTESYALKTVARWLGFEWRNPEASGSQSIFWYDRWLETGDRTLLDAIVQYNEDDCLATRHLKDWLVKFIQSY
ncbi:TM0106 family RecB-like putative nuclease [Aliterella atlantica]|uniref:Recombinase B n=1 Tax=Aliterella atlantica CENA595 TaxID=1618023 RepID=A0A0D8ZYK0_9CYAN|nr:TM0106 family RecB-like putative nuclease [Aliterella atlantica]KJH73534.1 recombinase B [Aliterella atlantica CENA595]